MVMKKLSLIHVLLIHAYLPFYALGLGVIPVMIGLFRALCYFSNILPRNATFFPVGVDFLVFL